MEKSDRVKWLQKTAEASRLKFPSTGAREKAATACGISRQMHHKLEYGQVDPADLQFKTIAKIAVLLNQSLDEIAELLGLAPRHSLTQIRLGGDRREGLDMSEEVKRVAEYLQALLEEKALDWENEGHLRIFAYGPGGPESPDNVWRPEELPRLTQLIEGEVDKLQGSDYFRLARCVSVITGKKIPVKSFIAMAKGENLSNPGPDLQECRTNSD